MKKKKSGCFQDDEFKIIPLPNGMILNMVNGYLKKHYKFKLDSDLDQIEFCFFKQAHLEFRYLDETPDLSATPMQTHLIVNKEKEGQGIYFTDTPCQWINIRFSIQALGHFFSCLGPGSTSDHLIEFLKSEKFFSHNSVMNPQMYSAFKALFLCPFDRDEHVLYAQAKCMELIALKLMEIEKPLPPFRKANTREEVIAGKTASILLENMAHPPSLQELADRVGVSSSRLKQIFPKIYGTSPFGFLRHHRLEHARDLMVHSGFSASEAALHVGYSELSPFHRAFVKEFGISPGQCRSNPV